ncbi:Ger(x)C family spore germination protein [Sporosarcina sp. FSL K6-2383]|uniref:Ger(x)C family spore germination protein n=1 Tax=Sporosarcina sp. FSL K6-2383 TaxID=2921556 RepID=UPI00315B0117
MRKIYFFILLLVLCVSLVGCTETKILERVSLVTLVGYDMGKEESVETTAVVRQVGTELQSKVVIITSENETSQGTRVKVNYRAAEKLMSGQLRGTLFGEEFAENGIGHYIDTLMKNHTLSERMLLAVVEGETRPLLEYQYPEIDEIGEHIYKLLDQNIKSEQVVSSTLHEVAYDYYSIGRDIALPIIKKDEELVAISGIALFRKDKMKGKLPIEDSFFIKLSRNDYQNGTLEIKIKGDDFPASLIEGDPEEIFLVFDPIKTQRDVKLVNPTTPEFDVHLKVQARLLEIRPDVNIENPEKMVKFEKAIGKKLESEISRVIAYCQEMDSDVFGYGDLYRSSVRHSELTEEKWHEMYKEMKVNVKVDFRLLRSGVFE